MVFLAPLAHILAHVNALIFTLRIALEHHGRS
jgi:hypothetical protein